MEHYHPNLYELCLCFKKFPWRFEFGDICEAFEENMLQFFTGHHDELFRSDDLYIFLEAKFNASKPYDMFFEVVKVLHRVGFIGIKPESYMGISWSYEGFEVKNISEENTFFIHKAFWRVLGISP